MKWLLVIMILGGFSILPLTVNAQEWSSAQEKVWSEVERYWDLHAQGDLEGFLGYFHKDYVGWYNRSALPADKASLRKWVKLMFESEKVILYEIKPVGISIFGDVAIVHYYYSQLVEQNPEKTHNEQGRWTDILMKQGDKWLLIGDHGGPMFKK